MTTGDIATWVIFAIIVVLFCFGLRRVYHRRYRYMGNICYYRSAFLFRSAPCLPQFLQRQMRQLRHGQQLLFRRLSLL